MYVTTILGADMELFLKYFELILKLYSLIKHLNFFFLKWHQNCLD